MVVARTGRKGELFRNQVEVDGCEGSLLFIATGDVVEERIIGIPDRGVVRGSPRRRYDRTEARLGAFVEPIGVLMNLVVFPEQTGDRTQPPVIRCAQAQLVALVCVLLVIPPC